MKTKQLALDALKHALLQESPKDIDWDRLESAIAALEADIAQAVEPVDAPPCWYCDFGKYGQITMRRDEADTAAANGAKVTRYTTPPEPAVNAELLDELRVIADANPMNWDAPYNDTATFQAWAQNRARAAIAKATS
jgi:hypothetical protein